MKFNAIVGNPPYQQMREGTNRSNSLYHLFIDVARELKPEYISMITPSRWMTRGAQSIPDSWIDEMLYNNHFLRIYDYPNAADCFDNVEIKGGVNYFLFSDSYTGKCLFNTRINNSESVSEMYLDESRIGIVIRNSMAAQILSKVTVKEGEYFKTLNFSDYVSSQAFFGQDNTLNSNWTGYSRIKDTEHNIKCYVNRRLDPTGYGWVTKEQIQKEHNTIPLHKVYIPEAGGSGSDPNVLSKPFYGEPNSVCSKTYLIIGFSPIDHNFTKEECDNIISYIHTRFFRFMVSIRKTTQHATKEVYKYVPLQDWSKPWTDEELYRKYNLSKEEIDFIESRIKPMA